MFTWEHDGILFLNNNILIPSSLKNREDRVKYILGDHVEVKTFSEDNYRGRWMFKISFIKKMSTLEDVLKFYESVYRNIGRLEEFHRSREITQDFINKYLDGNSNSIDDLVNIKIKFNNKVFYNHDFSREYVSVGNVMKLVEKVAFYTPETANLIVASFIDKVLLKPVHQKYQENQQQQKQRIKKEKEDDERKKAEQVQRQRVINEKAKQLKNTEALKSASRMFNKAQKQRQRLEKSFDQFASERKQKAHKSRKQQLQKAWKQAQQDQERLIQYK